MRCSHARRVAAGAALGHHVTMQRERSDGETAAWKAGDAERNERARIERLRRDGARSPSENLTEGVQLARTARAFFGAALPKQP